MKIFKKIFLFLVCILFLSLSSHAYADTSTGTVSIYSELYSSDPNTHYSGFSAQTYAAPLTARSTIHLTTPNLNGTITSVSVTYSNNSTNTSGKSICIYVLSRVETGTASWNKYDATNNWSVAGGDFNSTAVNCQNTGGAGSSLTFDVSSVVTSFNQSYDFLTKWASEDSSNVYANYASASFSITYTPSSSVSATTTSIFYTVSSTTASSTEYYLMDGAKNLINSIFQFFVLQFGVLVFLLLIVILLLFWK